jgi:hypothetical protein
VRPLRSTIAHHHAWPKTNWKQLGSRSGHRGRGSIRSGWELIVNLPDSISPTRAVVTLGGLRGSAGTCTSVQPFQYRELLARIGAVLGQLGEKLGCGHVPNCNLASRREPVATLRTCS